jgi:putative ABC transport system permease protein
MPMVGRRHRRPGLAGPDLPRSRVAARDLFGEAVAGLLQRPGRTAMTAAGTVLGVGAFVAVLGLTATASGQIDARFTALVATEVLVEDTGGSDPLTVANAFPADAEVRMAAITGVRHAGVWWRVHAQPPLPVTAVPLPGSDRPPEIEVVAASPGLLRALRPTAVRGRLFDQFHDGRGEAVAVLGSAAAARLEVTNLAVQPAVLIDGVPFTVVGILDDVQRQPDALFQVLVPRRTAELLWGPPDPGDRARMLVDTEVGAATVVADQAPLALRPDAPDLFRVIAPPDPRSLRERVATDLGVLFLLLAAVSLVIGAVGITNTTMIAVLERVAEIGLRRALGARPRHVGAQFLTESAAVGTLGGLVGTSLGVVTVVSVAAARQWTPLLEPWTAVPAPLIGTVVGVLAGAYPALRAARIEPVEALRR